MRMWMVDPALLCRKHLIGEHGEIHKHRHNFVKMHSIFRRFGQIEPLAMKKRHDELVIEMLNRNFNHQSPYEMPDLSYLSERDRNGKVEINKSIEELKNRCSECCARIQNRNK